MSETIPEDISDGEARYGLRYTAAMMGAFSVLVGTVRCMKHFVPPADQFTLPDIVWIVLFVITTPWILIMTSPPPRKRGASFWRVDDDYKKAAVGIVVAGVIAGMAAFGLDEHGEDMLVMALIILFITTVYPRSMNGDVAGKETDK